ncbi:hypothetical protein F4778DRAFT_742185 [Xylariomycetidae sp. FL2044]|nr:hypothetical protein F4778DRAFT_742185 [Xylariomycetidae sp. FL2044]
MERPGRYVPFPYYAPPDPHGQFRRLFTYGVIGVNTLVFLYWDMTPHQLFMRENFTLGPRNIRQGRWWTLLTAAISHQHPGHLAANMVSFYTYTELALRGGVSPSGLVVLSVCSALAGSYATLVDWKHKGVHYAASLGASGMVCGLAMATTLINPRQPVQIKSIPRPVPLWAFTATMFAYDMYQLSNMKSKIGHAGHIGGALCGAVYYFLRLRRINRWGLL